MKFKESIAITLPHLLPLFSKFSSSHGSHYIYSW